MGRIELTRTITTRAGVAGTYAAFNTGDGNYYENNQNSVLHVKNTNGASRFIHIITPKTEDGRPIKDVVIEVATATEVFIGPFANSLYGTGGQVQVDCYDENGITFNDTTDVASGTKVTSGVTAAVIQLGSL